MVICMEYGFAKAEVGEISAGDVGGFERRERRGSIFVNKIQKIVYLNDFREGIYL